MKKFLLHIGTLGLTFLFTGSFAIAQYGTIKGRIIGSDTVLVAANVAAGDHSVMTDQRGEFTLTLLPGKYRLVASFSGYQKINREIEIIVNEVQSLELIMIPSEQLGEVVVIGSRSGVKRSNLHTPVPIDVLSAVQLGQTGQTSIPQMLNYTAPSVNASRQTLNEPITLRGLYPDQLLILVNGIRQHNMGWVNEGVIGGVLGKGSVSNDLNVIPFSAIDKIEILRDGASAQYGSDAIAGVINVLLKDSIGKSSINFHSGQFYQGDGQNLQFEVNSGISLNGRARPGIKKGFLNFSVDMSLRDPTYRGGIYTGTIYTNKKTIDDSIVKARNFDRARVSNAGDASAERIGALINGAYQVNKNLEIFWTGLFNNRKSIFDGAYRFPQNTRLVNEDLYPDGFKGRAIEVVKSFAGMAGIRGKWKETQWDYTSSFGNNTENYYGENTNNASQYLLGKTAPTSFYTGTLIFQNFINAINFNRKFHAGELKVRSINLAYGAEWRSENFRMKPGEEAAWQDYDPTGLKDGGSQSGLIISPTNAVNKSRNIIGGYIDLETEVDDHLLIDMASRYEYYNDFGGNIAGKLAARYKVGNRLTFRASINNGYRAPSMQQRYYGTISKGVSLPTFTIVRKGIFNNDNEVVKLFGVPPLEPERSINISGGATLTIGSHVDVTTDAYWIQIKNRIVLSGTFDRTTNSEVDSLLVNYPDIDQVAFFTNAINTRTHGLDLVINSGWNIHSSHLSASLAANFTQTKLFGKIKTASNLQENDQQTNTLFNRQEIVRVEEGQPRSKMILSLYYRTGKLGFQVRNTRFGKTRFAFNPDSANHDEFFSAKIITDVAMSYHFKKVVTISLGANNVFNVYPDPLKNPVNTAGGRNIYSTEAQPFGFNGGYYYIALNFTF